MRKLLIIDVKRLYEEFHRDEIDNNTFVVCYSIAEHTLLDLGYFLEPLTNDAREKITDSQTRHFVACLKKVIGDFLMGVPAGINAQVSVHKQNKSFLIRVDDNVEI